jgi:hypothetical protein
LLIVSVISSVVWGFVNICFDFCKSSDVIGEIDGVA